MLFSQAQVLELTGVSLERFRHWRKEMPELAKHKGRTPSFTFEELVALTLMNRLTDELGVSASRLSPHSTSIFALLAEDQSIGEVGTVLCVSSDGVAIARLPISPDDAVLAIIRTDIVASDLYSRVVPPIASPQLDLPLS